VVLNRARKQAASSFGTARVSKRVSGSTKTKFFRAVYQREAATIGKTQVVIPSGHQEARIEIGGHEIKLTNLNKLFWPQPPVSKRDLLQYYADTSPVLLPHPKNRAMVMKRYPNGAEGDFFFQKRIPDLHPEWVETCQILHASGSKIRFRWFMNLGCIDFVLNHMVRHL
jgi:hypothetical protein